MVAHANHYFGPRQQAILQAYQDLPAGLFRSEAAARLGISRTALNAVVRNAKRRGLISDLTPEEAAEEIEHLRGGGIPHDEACRRLGIIPRTPLSGAVNRLRRSHP